MRGAKETGEVPKWLKCIGTDLRGRPTERDGLRIRDEIDGQHQFSSFLTTEANATVAAVRLAFV